MVHHNTGRYLPLDNAVRVLEAIETLLGRDPDEPGFGVVAGRAGLGKSCGAIYAANIHRGWVIEVKSCSTQRGFCLQLCRELGIAAPARTIEGMVEQIGEQLADHPRRPLFIDEADHLARRNMIELVRDIYRLCAPAGSAIVMIGEQAFTGLLRKWERIDSRILVRVEAQPASADDLAKLAERICGGIILHPLLRDRIMAASKGSARRIVGQLVRVRERAMVEGRICMGVEDMPGEAADAA